MIVNRAQHGLNIKETKYPPYQIWAFTTMLITMIMSVFLSTDITLNKMAVILEDDIFKLIFLHKKCRILIQTSLKF